MTQERISMRKLKEVLRLHYECNLSNRKIARALTLSATTVGYYVKAAQSAGVDWQDLAALNDESLAHKLLPDCPSWCATQQASPIDFQQVHQQLKQKGVTRELLHKEYLQDCPNSQRISYTEFCRRYRVFKKQLKPSMRQTHKAGEKIFVDYAGPTVPIYNPNSGDVVQAMIFVGVLGASNYTYVEATLTRSLPDWIGAHVRMFDFFGGVSSYIIPDNEKSAVSRACHYDPDINPNYAALAAHYQTAVIPTRPYHPKDKAKVEVAVQIVERWILGQLRHRQFFSLAELNTAIAALLDVLNNKPFQKLPGSRRSMFEEIEQGSLKPLPPTPYEFAIIKEVQVNLDYHVHIDHHYYSVPHHHMGKRVEYHLSEKQVAIFAQGDRIALHTRSYEAGKATTVKAHMPKAHLAHQAWTPAVFLKFATTVGEAMQVLATFIIEHKKNPECCYRIYLGFKNLSKRFGASRLNEACQYALKNDLRSFTHVKSILKTQVHHLPDEAANDGDPPTAMDQHDNLRGATYYKTTGDCSHE